MATFTIRVLKGVPGKKAKQGFFSVIGGISDSFDSIDVLANSEFGVDLALRWSEERTINNVISEDGIKAIQISLEKVGYLSARECGRYWYASNLGRHSVSLSSEALASFQLTPIKLSLRDSLSEPSFRGAILENVRVSDLSVDAINSLRAEIPSCVQSALLKLIKGTDARVTSFAIALSDERRFIFSANGTVKVRIADPIWEQAVKEVEPLIKTLIQKQ